MLFRICISVMINWWVLFIIGLLYEKNAFIENTKLSTCNISNVISIAIVDSAHCQDIAKKIIFDSAFEARKWFQCYWMPE